MSVASPPTPAYFAPTFEDLPQEIVRIIAMYVAADLMTFSKPRQRSAKCHTRCTTEISLAVFSQLSRRYHAHFANHKKPIRITLRQLLAIEPVQLRTWVTCHFPIAKINIRRDFWKTIIEKKIADHRILDNLIAAYYGKDFDISSCVNTQKPQPQCNEILSGIMYRGSIEQQEWLFDRLRFRDHPEWYSEFLPELASNNSMEIMWTIIDAIPHNVEKSDYEVYMFDRDYSSVRNLGCEKFVHWEWNLIDTFKQLIECGNLPACERLLPRLMFTRQKIWEIIMYCNFSVATLEWCHHNIMPFRPISSTRTVRTLIYICDASICEFAATRLISLPWPTKKFYINPTYKRHRDKAHIFAKAGVPVATRARAKRPKYTNKLRTFRRILQDLIIPA